MDSCLRRNDKVGTYTKALWELIVVENLWIPACAGMTKYVLT